MADELPEFDSPPVIETVLGIQFNSLPGYTTSHAGWFRSRYLGSEWTEIRVVSSLLDQFEHFDDKRWQVQPSVKLFATPPPDRTQIIRNDHERMIQIQDTRFVYNWIKKSSEYPRYSRLLPEFREYFKRFTRFAVNASLGNLIVNQWEVTYVNHVPKGDLWSVPKGWSGIVRNICVPTITNCAFDGINGEWLFKLEDDNSSRLRISLQHARGRPSGPELLRIHLIARGNLKSLDDIVVSLDRGHEAVVRGFTAITTQKAHKYWRRTR